MPHSQSTIDVGSRGRAHVAGRTMHLKAPPQRVLVVDDEKSSADSVALLLTSMGHTVRQAYDGPSAVKIGLEFVPELVLLDLTMPGADGFEVARQLRDAPATRRTKIFALTGNGDQAYREATAEAQFDGHLVKPLDVKELAEVLRWTRSPFTG